MMLDPKQGVAAGRGEVFPGAEMSRVAGLPSNAPHGDYFITACALYGWRDHLEAANVSYAELADLAGIKDVDVTQFGGYVSLSQFTHFLELAADACDDELIALRWAATVNILALGPFMLCFAYAPTMRMALDVLVRYLTVHVDAVNCSVSEHSGMTTFSWRYSPVLFQRDQLIDRGAALFIGRMRAILPANTAPLRVELARRRPASVALHYRLFGSNVLFDADRNLFTYSNEMLDLRNPNSDPNLFTALCELNARLLTERRCQCDLVLRVKEEILRRLAKEVVALEPIARQLGYSSRGLQRRLAEYHTTFNNLLELTRREAAKRYIEETDFQISEISYRLGFSTIGNFTRAAKRWFGCTPREYRQGLQASAKDG